MNLNGERSQEIIEVRPPQLAVGLRWQPIIGDETIALLNSLTLSQHEKDRLRDESLSILGHCIPPAAADAHEAGLIVGNIQSGKTLSFTTVSALARDNGYRIIIVITGTVKILSNQSIKRLTNQLRLSTRSDFAWKLYRNPRNSQAQAQEMTETLRDWESPTPGGLQPQTILITLLKHAGRLRNASALLERLNLHSVPVLVIDDEADQAGLNTAVNQGSQSATYRDLCRLRASLPHHTYLGYTATPQAPLLINIMDMLSARFAKVLTPGADYTGGITFFEHQPPLIRTIPDNQIPSDTNPIHEPTESFIEALRVFFIGVSAGLLGLAQREGPQNRSMLVHPSMLTAQHASFFNWVQTLKTSWRRLLDNTEQADQPDKDSLIADFRNAYTDLAATEPGLPSFDAILRVLPQAISRTVVHEINRRPANQFPGIEDIDEFWKSNYSFILVGGQSLERGFTVEGLTVTYMPRGIGVGHADTVQQRARFYGYNRRHLGYCRVFLENDARDAYQVYIDHEDRLRRSLANHINSGRPLNEWRRAFFLDNSLKPTRDNVLDIDYTRGPDPDVAHDAMPPIYSPEDLDENRSIVNAFFTRCQFVPNEGDPRRTVAQKHWVARNVPLTDAFANLLVPFRIMDPLDSWKYLQIRLQIQRYLEAHPNAVCSIYRMKPEFTDFKRTLGSDGKIEPYQGANASTGYPGDSKIYDQGILTIQIYQFSQVKQRDTEAIIATNVHEIAVVLPSEIAVGMVVQDQGGGH